MNLLTIVFLKLAKASAIWVLNSIDGVIGFGEINLVLISNDLSLRLSLETHLNNVSGFVIEKSVGVTQPGNCTEKNTKKRIG